MEQIQGSKPARFISYIVAGMMLLLPVHALLTVWLASVVGHYTLLRLWKELLVLLVAVPVWYMLWHNQTIRYAFLHSRLIRAVALYAALQCLFGLLVYQFGWVTGKAVGYALIINLRFLLFFLICMVLGRESMWLHRHWRIILFAPAVAVVGFGLLQVFVLPSNVLTHVGYGPDTIPAVSLVDNKAEYIRVQSTLRGANPLGAYLVIILAALATLAFKYRHLREWRIGAGVLAGVLLLCTFSRSAWIGALLALVVVVGLWLLQTRRHLIGWVVGAVAILLVVIASATFGLRNQDVVQNYLFHTDEHSLSEQSSNQARADALAYGFKDIAQHPFGEGPGSAGPASIYNNGQPQIAENYFLQIGQEVGLIGLALFVFITVAVVRRLWQLREQSLSIFLLASLAGLTVTSLLWHVWTDDTIAYLWWGFAGVAVAPLALGDRKHDAKNRQT